MTDESAPPTPRLHGVLVTFRRPDELEKTLGRLADQSKHLDRLIVVDNDSDRSVAVLVERFEGCVASKISYLDSGENIGPAGGYALGMRELLESCEDDDWVVLLDDDDPPYSDNTIERASLFARQMHIADPAVGGVGVSGGRFDARSGRVLRVGDDELGGPIVVDHVTGGGFPAYRAGAVREVGLPCSELFFGFEELEYGLRLTDAGRALYADGDAWLARRAAKRDTGELPPEDVSVRRAQRSSIRLAEPSWRRYYSLRNLIYILRRRGHWWTAVKISLLRGILKPLANIPVDPRRSWQYLSLGFRAARDGWLGRLGRTVAPG
ncbi:MAG: glycosyltransferase [Acidimicrobiia bacterium]|jgi:GT2 family glycosyltransferase